MAFNEIDWETLLPSYLVDEEKSRLRDSLMQFRQVENAADIDYRNFYLPEDRDYFMQSDVIDDIRLPFWNLKHFEEKYVKSMILSNTCDISSENERGINIKMCLFAPLYDLDSLIEDIKEDGRFEDKLDSHVDNIKKQMISNIFYLPPNENDGKEYIVLLDKIFWFPTEELNELLASIEEDKLFSLNLFGHYLFTLKLSYHMCRLPESCDRLVKP